jgi:predicted nicotinamide N-methyase
MLELGSGTGILGMAVSKLLPSDVCNRASSCLLLTDGDKHAVELLRTNVVNSFNDIDDSIVGCKELVWGDTDSTCAMEEWCHSRWKHIWNDSSRNCSFTMILAGDVLYKPELPSLFFSTVRRLIEEPAGVLWLCHVPRANVAHEIVVTAAEKAGFSVEAISIEDIPVEGCPDEDLSRARVYRMMVDVSRNTEDDRRLVLGVQ